MDHPNIARVFDAGATEIGRPYFVMELVNGIPITKYCDQQHLNPEERLRLFIPICRAIQHAHQKGIIHRDLKPSNILVAMYDGRAVPKVIDFGVAKAIGQTLTDKTMYTSFGQVVGTLEYMSPEQSQRNQLDVDTRTDIYSLGVVLYELLTGDTPLDRQRLRSAAFDEMLRIIRDEEPPKPSVRLSRSDNLPSVAANRHVDPHKLTSLVKGDLDWIVMKSLEKDRQRRYDTANAFAGDVAKYLLHEPASASPPSAVYRLQKFVRRNRAVLATTTAIVLLLVAVAAIEYIRTSLSLASETEHRQIAEDAVEQKEDALKQKTAALDLAEKANKIAEDRRRQLVMERDITRSNLYLVEMRAAEDDWNSGDITSMRSHLDAYCPRPGDKDLRGWEWYYLLSLTNEVCIRSGVTKDQLTVSRGVPMGPELPHAVPTTQ